MITLPRTSRAIRIPLHYNEFFVVVVGSNQAREVANSFSRLFRVLPPIFCVVSSRNDEEWLRRRAGFPEEKIINLAHPFRTNASEARQHADIYIPKIVKKFEPLLDTHNSRNLVLLYSAFGGTFGIVPPLVKELLASRRDLRVLTCGILPASSFSTPIQVRNLAFVRELESIAGEHVGRVANLVYSDVGGFGEVSAKSLAAEWLAHMIYVQEFSSSNPLNIPVFHPLHSGKAQQGKSSSEEAEQKRGDSLGVPFLVRTDLAEPGVYFESIENIARNLEDIVNRALRDCEWSPRSEVETCLYVILPVLPRDHVEWKETLAGILREENAKFKDKIVSAPVEIIAHPYFSRGIAVGYVRGLEITVRGEKI